MVQSVPLFNAFSFMSICIFHFLENVIKHILLSPIKRLLDLTMSNTGSGWLNELGSCRTRVAQ